MTRTEVGRQCSQPGSAVGELLKSARINDQALDTSHPSSPTLSEAGTAMATVFGAVFARVNICRKVQFGLIRAPSVVNRVPVGF
jgi:hypothetical protein